MSSCCWGWGHPPCSFWGGAGGTPLQRPPSEGCDVRRGPAAQGPSRARGQSPLPMLGSPFSLHLPPATPCWGFPFSLPLLLQPRHPLSPEAPQPWPSCPSWAAGARGQAEASGCSGQGACPAPSSGSKAQHAGLVSPLGRSHSVLGDERGSHHTSRHSQLVPPAAQPQESSPPERSLHRHPDSNTQPSTLSLPLAPGKTSASPRRHSSWASPRDQRDLQGEVGAPPVPQAGGPT